MTHPLLLYLCPAMRVNTRYINSTQDGSFAVVFMSCHASKYKVFKLHPRRTLCCCAITPVKVHPLVLYSCPAMRVKLIQTHNSTQGAPFAVVFMACHNSTKGASFVVFMACHNSIKGASFVVVFMSCHASNFFLSRLDY